MTLTAIDFQPSRDYPCEHPDCPDRPTLTWRTESSERYCPPHMDLTDEELADAPWFVTGPKQFGDLPRIWQFIPAYTTRNAELEAAGQYPYNDSFKGHIPGLATATSKDEDSAIYMLQSMRGMIADARLVDEAWDEGFRPLDRATLTTEPQKVKGIVEFGWYSGAFPSGFKRRDDVRLFLMGGTEIADDKQAWLSDEEWRSRVERATVGILPKGKRTRGYIAKGELLVLR